MVWRFISPSLLVLWCLGGSPFVFPFEFVFVFWWQPICVSIWICIEWQDISCAMQPSSDHLLLCIFRCFRWQYEVICEITWYLKYYLIYEVIDGGWRRFGDLSGLVYWVTGDEGSWLLLILSHYILHPATHIDLYNAHQDFFCLVKITFSVVLWSFPSYWG